MDIYELMEYIIRLETKNKRLEQERRQAKKATKTWTKLFDVQ